MSLDLPTDRPLLLLDVDGVLNPSTRSQNWKRYDFHRVHGSDGCVYPVRFHKNLGERLIHLATHYALVWATMWDDDANRLLAPLLGLPELPVIPCFDNGMNFVYERRKIDRRHHKVPMIEKYVGDRPFAWVDDEVGQPDLDWAELRTDKTAPTKIIPIDCRMGLLGHHVVKLTEWAESIK